MKTRITKNVNGQDVEVGRKGEKRNQANSEERDPESPSNEQSSSEEGSRGVSKYSVNLTVFNRYAPGKVLTEIFHSDETDILKEVKSEAAYQALKNLLVGGALRTIGRLDAKFPERAHSRFGRRRPYNNRNNRRNGKASREARGKTIRGKNRGKSPKALPAGQTIMMPVTQNSKGQYVIVKDAQPCLIMQPNSADGNAAPSKSKKKRRSPKSRNAKKNQVPEPAMAGITEGVNNVAIAAN